MREPISLPLVNTSSLLSTILTCYRARKHAFAYAAFQEYTRFERARRRERIVPRAKIAGRRISEERLYALSDEDCLSRFRMTADEIMDVITAMDIPDVVKTSEGHVFEGLEAFCLILARFRTAGDISELTRQYNRSSTAISFAINQLVQEIDDNWAHLLHFDREGVLCPENLREFARAVHEHGSPVETVWGFLDTTHRRTCRPSLYQQQAYNGHKKNHGLKFQAVVAPNGLFVHLSQPFEGRRADPGILRDTGLMDLCSQHAFAEIDGIRRPLQLYGDAAYGLSDFILSPFCDPEQRSPEELEWNRAMGLVRIDVEHGFGIISQTWPFLNAGWKMKLYTSPVGRYYRVGVLLSNALNCLRPNQVSRAFNLPPPDLFDYFHY
ncbi:hypothetical protein SCHPADRAFT_834370 [Schizopora paradoxa]|uniref:DDE Tnp4 domain-containing protein n=1 Tax=Schizopora paradoxa TaxID=27342 RepID=A0A0H2RWE7_9AGAM|nr:hypothetical protein SCHPADRAFT_834370 [Schizopora paradoxa]